MIRNAKKIFFALTVIALMVMASVPPVHALPTTGTFAMTFNQTLPVPFPSAGSGTFTANAGNVTSYDFEFVSPLPEEFSGPPEALTWNGTSLSGFDFAEYISGGFLQFLGVNNYEISFPLDAYTNNQLGSVCLGDTLIGNCLAAIGTYSVNQVPEPSSLVLLAIGLAVNSLRRRSRELNISRASRL